MPSVSKIFGLQGLRLVGVERAVKLGNASGCKFPMLFSVVWRVRSLPREELGVRDRKPVEGLIPSFKGSQVYLLAVDTGLAG